MKIFRPLLLGLVFCSLPQLAVANGQKGIAFVLAPEAAMGVCAGATPTAAFDCARQKCVAGGGAESECAVVAWCMPAGWSASAAIMHKEGIHWSEFTCGWPSKAAALAAAHVRCAAQNPEFIQDCVVGAIWDEDAQEIPNQ